jgi:hydrogenase nickel incorporation protein HypB
MEVIKLEKSIFAENDHFADANRQIFSEKKSLTFNLVSSPGSGKTSLLEKTTQTVGLLHPIAVIEGDQQTDIDAKRIRRAGAEAYQINTGKACHLDAHRVGHALTNLEIKENTFVFIENVGNLICPALFSLGEHHRVVIISVTEGDDKPLKYPDIFFSADTVVLNKIDLLPYIDFNLDRCIENLHKIRPKQRLFPLSVTSGEGMDAWIEWLLYLMDKKVKNSYASAQAIS